MKKVLFVFIFSITCVSIACAQYMRFGISGGAEMSNYAINWNNSPDKSTSSELNPKLGFRVAMEVDINIIGDLYLVPELAFTQRGTKGTTGTKYQNVDENKGKIGEEYIEYTTFTENINCLQLPVNVMYKFETGDDAMFCIFAGPYVSWHLTGKIKDHRTNINEKIKFGHKAGQYKPVDLGFSFGVGLEYMDFFVRAQYNYGLTNLLNGQSVDFSRNRNAGFSVGYLF
jgi:hypothetical protein